MGEKICLASPAFNSNGDHSAEYQDRICKSALETKLSMLSRRFHKPRRYQDPRTGSRLLAQAKKEQRNEGFRGKRTPENNIEDLSSATQDVNEDVTPSMLAPSGMPYQNYHTEADMWPKGLKKDLNKLLKTKQTPGIL